LPTFWLTLKLAEKASVMVIGIAGSGMTYRSSYVHDAIAMATRALHVVHHCVSLSSSFFLNCIQRCGVMLLISRMSYTRWAVKRVAFCYRR